MKRTYFAVAAVLTILIILVFGGCGELLKAESGFELPSGGGGGGDGTAAMVIPGAGGGTTADNLLDTSYIGTGKMRVVPISKLEVSKEEITTQATLGLWKKDDKFHIEGFNQAFNGTFANAGFTDTSLLYYDRAFDVDEEFTFSARVRILRVGGVSTGKGIHFGAYAHALKSDGTPKDEADTTIVDSSGIVQKFGDAQNTKGVGMFFRCEAVPQFRLYYSDKYASTTAGTGVFGNLSELKVNREYVYEFARRKYNGKMYYTYKLFDSKTGETVFDSVTTRKTGGGWEGETNPWNGAMGVSLPVDAPVHPFGTPVELNDALKGKVFAGVCIAGSAAEISQIKVWYKSNPNWTYSWGMDENGDVFNTIFGMDASGNTTVTVIPVSVYDRPDFRTPDTIPAYVPVEKFRGLLVTPAKNPLNGGIFSETSENIYSWTSSSSSLQWGGLEAANYTITVTPQVSPLWAESTIFFQFYRLDAETASYYSAFRLEGSGEHKPTGAPESTWEQGKIIIDPSKLASGVMAEAKFKVVARDPSLDVPGPDGKDSPEYSLKQTLAESYFRIQVTKP